MTQASNLLPAEISQFQNVMRSSRFSIVFVMFQKSQYYIPDRDLVLEKVVLTEAVSIRIRNDRNALVRLLANNNNETFLFPQMYSMPPAAFSLSRALI